MMRGKGKQYFESQMKRCSFFHFHYILQEIVHNIPNKQKFQNFAYLLIITYRKFCTVIDYTYWPDDTESAK